MTVCVEPTGHTLLAVGLVIFGTTTSRLSRDATSIERASAIRLESDDDCRVTSGEPRTARGDERSSAKRKRQENSEDRRDSIANMFAWVRGSREEIVGCRFLGYRVVRCCTLDGWRALDCTNVHKRRARRGNRVAGEAYRSLG